MTGANVVTGVEAALCHQVLCYQPFNVIRVENFQLLMTFIELLFLISFVLVIRSHNNNINMF
jgi:hypothetical protein